MWRYMTQMESVMEEKLLTPKEVAEILPCYEALRAQVPIHEFNRLALRDTKTPIRAGWRIDPSEQRCGWTASSRIDAFIIMRRLHGQRQVFT